MKEVLARIRREMGDNALIISTREMSGVMGRRHVEVTAAADDKPAVRVADGKPAARAADNKPAARLEKLPPPGLEEQIIKNRVLLGESLKPLKEELFGLRSIVDEMRREAGRGPDLGPLKEEMRDLKRLVSALAHGSNLAEGLRFSEPLKDLYRRLVASEVEESLAFQLIEMLDAKLAAPEKNDAAAALAGLRELICLAVATSKPVAINDGRPSTLAFVGPTGVGKTTTVAKLAARCSLQLKRRVSLITIDTYRIAAVEQLKTYARIMDLPIFVCYSPAEMREAIEQNRESALILIDTAGHSQTDEEQIADLRNYFADAPEIDVLLVLSATTKNNDLRDITSRFERIGPKKLVFTKLDETTTFGPIVNEAVRTRLPIAYFTTGQNVPDDIETASSAKLAGALLSDG